MLIESNAGLFGNDCCRLYGRTGFGELAEIAGGDNLVRDTMPANGAESSIENILHLNPQFYVLTGADWKQYNRRSEAVTLRVRRTGRTGAQRDECADEPPGISFAGGGEIAACDGGLP